ncbi:MAG TPA: hypothetical protein VIR03_01460 [Candidatus Saccharimonadales bacterium]
MNDDWKTKRYRYQITLKSGKVVMTDYYDTYQDLENFIRTGYAGVFVSGEGYVELPLNGIQAVQPIEEGQQSGHQPPETPYQPLPEPRPQGQNMNPQQEQDTQPEANAPQTGSQPLSQTPSQSPDEPPTELPLR